MFPFYFIRDLTQLGQKSLKCFQHCLKRCRPNLLYFCTGASEPKNLESGKFLNISVWKWVIQLCIILSMYFTAICLFCYTQARQKKYEVQIIIITIIALHILSSSCLEISSHFTKSQLFQIYSIMSLTIKLQL